jgi:hypothetical protein
MSESSRHLPTYCDAFPRMHALSPPFSRLSAYSRARALTHFHALMHFAPDRTQTAYQSLLNAFLHNTMDSRMRAFRTPFLCLSACSRARTFVRFHALMHFVPDHTQTAYHDSRIRVFSVPSHIMQCIPAHVRLACLSRAHQHVPALAHLHIFVHSPVFML